MRYTLDHCSNPLLQAIGALPESSAPPSLSGDGTDPSWCGTSHSSSLPILSSGLFYSSSSTSMITQQEADAAFLQTSLDMLDPTPTPRLFTYQVHHMLQNSQEASCHLYL